MAGMVECVRIGEPVPLEWQGLSWYVATVRPGRDFHAREELEAQGLPVFMMEGRRTVRVGKNRRRVLKAYPVFPGYLFVGDIAGALACLSGRLASHLAGEVGRTMDALASDSISEGASEGIGESISSRREISPARMRRGYKTDITGFIGQGSGISRVNGGVMQDMFVWHESGMFVPGSVRADLRSRVKVGDVVKLYGSIPAIVERFHSGGRIEVASELFCGQASAIIPLKSLDRIEV